MQKSNKTQTYRSSYNTYRNLTPPKDPQPFGLLKCLNHASDSKLYLKVTKFGYQITKAIFSFRKQQKKSDEKHIINCHKI